MPLPDSAAIDSALVARLAGDAELKGYMPDGVFYGQAPPNLRNFVLVSLIIEHDLALFDLGYALDDALYLVKAVSFGTSATAMKKGAYRIFQLLEDYPLAADGFGCFAMHREQRLRYPEQDDVDPSIMWQHGGGHYRVQMTALP